jgi:hypothetical protein
VAVGSVWGDEKWGMARGTGRHNFEDFVAPAFASERPLTPALSQREREPVPFRRATNAAGNPRSLDRRFSSADPGPSFSKPNECGGKSVIIKPQVCFHQPGLGLRTGSRARRRGRENFSRIITFITSGDHREATKTQLALALAQGGSITGRARAQDATRPTCCRCQRSGIGSPLSRSCTACLNPTASARALKARPSGVCRAAPSKSVANICVAASPIFS